MCCSLIKPDRALLSTIIKACGREGWHHAPVLCYQGLTRASLLSVFWSVGRGDVKRENLGTSLPFKRAETLLVSWEFEQIQIMIAQGSGWSNKCESFIIHVNSYRFFFSIDKMCNVSRVYVAVQFYPWIEFYFPFPYFPFYFPITITRNKEKLNLNQG